MSNKQQHFIDNVLYKNSTFDNPQQALTQTKLLETVSSDIYSDPKRFIVEIIQNADDSSFSYDNKNLKLDITFGSNNFLIISHMGKPIDERDIEALCSAGNSTKSSDERTTGYKGIGFKSVFSHSEKVYVVSNGYYFKFDKSYFQRKKSGNRIGEIGSFRVRFDNRKVYRQL